MIYCQIGVIEKLDSGCMVYKTYIFVNSSFWYCETWKQNKRTSNTASILLFWVKVLFLSKKSWFLAKNADTSKIKQIVVLKGICSKNKCVCELTYQISSFWWWRWRSWWVGNFTPPTPPPSQNEPLKSPPRLGLMDFLLKNLDKMNLLIK